MIGSLISSCWEQVFEWSPLEFKWDKDSARGQLMIMDLIGVAFVIAIVALAIVAIVDTLRKKK
ncbi:hypothetical protein [Paraburkholderia caffeinilytica]|uniref:hypothetical protein n=1 Tax=Paraburkholderia caffeinilytica TaxID=1761016 RepID=UPI0038BD75B1